MRDWQFIGGQNQKLLDFFYDSRGIIMQQKSIGPYVKESTLNTYNSSFGKIIDNMAEVVRNGSYKLQDGSIITISKGQFDIVVQEGFNTSVLVVLHMSPDNVSKLTYSKIKKNTHKN